MKTRLISKKAVIVGLAALALLSLPKPSYAFPEIWWVICENCFNYKGTITQGDPCAGGGGNCSDYVPILILGVEPTGGSWNLNGEITDSAYAMTPVGSVPLSPIDYTFQSGMLLQIDSGAFSGVPAQTFDLSGITTDSLGNFTATNP